MQKLCIQRFFPLALCVVLFLLGGNASAYGAMQPLPDINLSDTSSAAIPVEGDFRLNLQFYAESLGSDNHAALNFRVGNDVLTIAFAGHEGVGTFGTFARLNGEHSITGRSGGLSPETGTGYGVQSHGCHRCGAVRLCGRQRSGCADRKKCRSALPERIMGLPGCGRYGSSRRGAFLRRYGAACGKNRGIDPWQMSFMP